jgi:hypothetical protein
MQYVIDARGCAFGKRGVGKITLVELGAAEVLEVEPFACYEIISDADAMSAPHKLFRKMRTNETRAARDQIRSHVLPALLDV